MAQNIIPTEKNTKIVIRGHIRNVSSLSGVIGPLIVTATTFLAHAFHENYDWLHQTISDLGTGPHGWIENIGFIVFGLLMIVFAEALFAGFAKKRSLIAATVVWALVGVGFLLMGAFQADPTALITVHGIIHTQTARVLGIFFPLACFLLLPSFEADPHWDNMTVYTMVTGIAFLLLILVRLLLPDTLFASWTGLFERSLLAIALAWLEIVAIKLLPHRRDLG